jgi:hypothetical protein
MQNDFRNARDLKFREVSVPINELLVPEFDR